MKNSAVVVGSLNQDLIIEVPRFPQVGESLMANDLTFCPGGKGANQAVQLAKLGVATTMVGCVGDDDYGRGLVAGIAEAGVDASSVRVCEGPTGMAVIESVPDGLLTCVVIRGANDAVAPADVDAAEAAIAEAAWLVLQLEVPQEANRRAIELAGRHGCRVVLNAAPAAPVAPEVLRTVDLLVLNEIEAAFYLGRPVTEVEGALEGARELRARHGTDCVITLGSLGSVFCAGDADGFADAVAVRAVETTGAGDSYVGALVRAFIDGASLGEACRFAARCSAVTVTRPGAQPAMPTLEELSARG